MIENSTTVRVDHNAAKTFAQTEAFVSAFNTTALAADLTGLPDVFLPAVRAGLAALAERGSRGAHEA